MPDPFRHVSPSDPVEFNSIAWNSWQDAGRAEKNRQHSRTSSVTPDFRQSTIIRIKNESGSDLDRNSILGLDGPLFAPSDSEDAFLRAVTFVGTKPSKDHHKRRYAVLIDPALDGSFARAYLAGVCQVKVNLLDSVHEYANITDGSADHLTSSRHGHARILWCEGEGPYGYGYDYGYDIPGIQWAIVMLGVTGSSVAIGIASGDIPPRGGAFYGKGKVRLVRSHNGAQDSASETIDVLNASQDTMTYGAGIDDGTYVSVAWDAEDVAWVAPLECGTGAYS